MATQTVTPITTRPLMPTPVEGAPSYPTTETGLGGTIGIISGVVAINATILALVLYYIQRRQIAAEVK
jgi:hypothetical protein